MNPTNFATGSTGAALAGIAANHLITKRTKTEKSDTDKQLAASLVGANVAHILMKKMATLQETLSTEKAAQFAFVKSFTKTATLNALKAGKSREEAAEFARTALQKSAAFQSRNQLIKNLEMVAEDMQPEKRAQVEKLASMGFQETDIKDLNRTNPALVEKLASASENAWSLGQPSNVFKQPEDPLFAFIMG